MLFRSIIDVLDRFGLANCSTITTPLSEDCELSKDILPSLEQKSVFIKGNLYKQLISALIYLTIIIRSNIVYVVEVLARFSADPGAAHWKAAKHLCRYF